MRQLRWTVSVRRDGDREEVALATFTRPVDAATAADFGLSLEEGRQLLGALQQTIAQSQIPRLRQCPAAVSPLRSLPAHQGLARARRHHEPGRGQFRVPRVISCLCTPEPLDDDDMPMAWQYLAA